MTRGTRRHHPLVRVWLGIAAALLIAGVATTAIGVTAAVAREGSLSAVIAAEGESHGEKAGKHESAGGHEAKFNPLDEFSVEHAFGPELKIGSVDMSITKPVIMLWIATILSCGFAVYVARRLRVRPDRKQTFVETIYEFCHDGIAKESLPGSVFSRYMPYLAALFVFIWINNLISFIPLPLNTHETLFTVGGVEIPSLGIYAATSNINVTLVLTILTILFTHFEGIRMNGAGKYFASWAAEGGIGLKLFTWPLHAISELSRIISLSVRLFANMLGGHLLILVMLALPLTPLMNNGLVAIGSVPMATAIYLLEFGLIATIQAFIFAMLSGVYIGGAAEPQH